MATDNIMLLTYLKRHARTEFPEAFSLVFDPLADPPLYTSIGETLEDGTDTKMVRIGNYDQHGKVDARRPLWACIIIEQVRYFWYSEPGALEETTAEDLYPAAGSTRHRDGTGPFALLFQKSWPFNKQKKLLMREWAREILEALVRFAFIVLKGRDPFGRSHEEVLQQVENLCKDLLKLKSAQPVPQLQQQDHKQSLTLSASAPGSKRNADESNNNAEPSGLQRTTRRRIDLSPPPVEEPNSQPSSPGDVLGVMRGAAQSSRASPILQAQDETPHMKLLASIKDYLKTLEEHDDNEQRDKYKTFENETRELDVEIEAAKRALEFKQQEREQKAIDWQESMEEYKKRKESRERFAMDAAKLKK